jgi:hypothetical protein
MHFENGGFKSIHPGIKASGQTGNAGTNNYYRLFHTL